MYDLTIAIINKCFEFQNDWLKIIRKDTIALNFVLYHCIKEIKNIEERQNFMNDMHQNHIKVQLNIKFHQFPHISS